MKKQVFGRQLKRDTNERKALFKGLVSSLTIYERIETTEEKAKAIRAHVEKLVTKAKKNESAHARSLLQAYLTNEALQKMLTDVAPRFVDRPGGYTRIIKIGNRHSDNASMVLMEWVEKKTKNGSNVTVPKKGDTSSDEAKSEITSAKTVKKPVKVNTKKEVKSPKKVTKAKKEIEK